MTTRVASLSRIWSAIVPCFTEWRSSGSRTTPNGNTTVACWGHAWTLNLLGVVRRTAPAAVVIACNLFR
jgi:hypothetical protein